MKITCVLLAAGLSHRMGENKLFLNFDGQTLISRTIELLDSIPFHQKIIVLNAENSARITLPNSFLAVMNPSPQDGQSSSVRLGTSHASGEAILFCTADQPYLNAISIKYIINKAKADSIVVPTFKKRNGNPTCFGKNFFQELLTLKGSEGGRSIIRRYQDKCVFVEMQDPRVLFDVDTKEDYEGLLGNT